jgi:perosamine synthetase
MSALQAALGLAQLERLGELVERKRQIFSWYKDALGKIGGVTLNHEAPGVKNTYWMVTAVIEAERGLTKTDLLNLMSEKNIDCRPFFHPLSSIPAYSKLPQAAIARSRNTNAYKISPYGINLPSGFNMTQEHVRYVSDCLKAILLGASA